MKIKKTSDQTQQILINIDLESVEYGKIIFVGHGLNSITPRQRLSFYPVPWLDSPRSLTVA